MLPRRRFHPDGHLAIGTALTHSHGLACGDMIFIGGQADISGEAKVTQPNDHLTQTKIAMEGVLAVLAGMGAEPGDLVKLTAFYVLDGAPEERNILETMAEMLGSLPGPGPAGDPGPRSKPIASAASP